MHKLKILLLKKEDVSFYGFILGILNILIIMPWYSGIFEENMNMESVYSLGIGILGGGLITILLSLPIIRIKQKFVSFVSLLLIIFSTMHLFLYKFSIINNTLYILNGILAWISLFSFFKCFREILARKLVDSSLLLRGLVICAIELLIFAWISSNSYYFMNFGSLISASFIFAGIYAIPVATKVEVSHQCLYFFVPFCSV
ncbi:MAG: hypothetical protein ACTSRZ_10175 [Promethearchaeota archaeon]